MMLWAHWLRVPAACGCLFIASLACSGTDADPFAQRFTEVARIELEEDAPDPIVGISAFVLRPGGGFVIVDEHANRVRE
jgi:hypothetical protein